MSLATSAFAYKNGELYCDAVAARMIADAAGTPTYVYRGGDSGALSPVSRGVREISASDLLFAEGEREPGHSAAACEAEGGV